MVLQPQPKGFVLCKPLDYGFAQICKGAALNIHYFVASRCQFTVVAMSRRALLSTSYYDCLRVHSNLAAGDPQLYYVGTDTYMAPELLRNRLKRLRGKPMSTPVDRFSADVYANGAMLAILLRSALRERPFQQYLFEPRSRANSHGQPLTEAQKTNAHVVRANLECYLSFIDWACHALLATGRA